ncbi:thioredoxin domain-containing protein [Saccharibacter sp. 17.LH.SD]|nr:DsbA family protein [Saccharibacter sp. 17.LH.SD]MXV45076.1 thioredoxin domain-containing protein [Saccharibacter sp. 17.LH.SD]
MAVASFSCMMGEVQAQEISLHVFNAEQRKAIVEVVRQALKDDPTILIDAMQSLRQKSAEHQQAQNLANVRANWSTISTAPRYAVRGNPQGAVTIVEFLDPRCGYCRRMAPIVDDFLKRHSDVRLVEKVVPVLGAASVVDTRAIYAAAFQGHYDSMRRALMQDAAKPDDGHLKEIARQQGMDVGRFMKDMSSPAVVEMIKSNLVQAQTIGLDGTPTFVFGQAAVVPGAMDADQMDRLLKATQGKH